MHTAALVVGIVVGIGIVAFPPIVAASADNTWGLLGLWLAGGLISLLGALCYAELATARPHAGGEYHFLHQAFGPRLAFLFAWARITVIQTGSIAVAAFIVGDHLSKVLWLGPFSAGIYASLVVGGLTALNIAGTAPAKDAQTLFAATVVTGLALLAGLALATQSPAAASAGPALAPPGLAMIFVLLAYGGWNEAAYLSAEVRDPQRNILRSLVLALTVITLLYLLVNLAFVRVLGLEGLRAESAPAVTLAQRLIGDAGGIVVALLVSLAAVSTVNGSILTGVRACYALGNDFTGLRLLGRWHGPRNAPVNALLVQGLIALALVVFGTLTQGGMQAMVEYTSPVFWFFLALTALTLFRFRHRTASSPIYRVPGYPLVPLLFFAACLYMLHASVVFTGAGALLGVLMVLVGLPLYVWLQRRERLAGQK
ncbi:MAG: amino acid permease [Spongiibacteraceae bacterium]|nr:amino acid permease [Spongiibacteraceae bacterium]